MFDRGYWKIGTLRGVPIRLHWTLPLGALVFSGGSFVPAFWLAFTLLILVHEFGHAALVRRFGHQNMGVDVTGFGGLCRWSGHASAFERSAIAWGGVLAQGLLLLGTLVLVLILGSPTSPHVAQIVNAFVRANLFLIVINLLPFPPLDGAEAWKILRQGRFQQLLARLRDSVHRLKPARSKKSAGKAGQVIDFGNYARRKREAPGKDVKHDVPKGSAKEVADELIRISEEAARARNKRNDN